MKIAYFSHALTSCWNHGNAHFQRGLLRELQAMGHTVVACEPELSWSRQNLVVDHGLGALTQFEAAYPELNVHVYSWPCDLAALLEDVRLVIVHEWTEPAVVAAIGRYARSTPGITLLFHDTHHRLVSEPTAMREYDLSDYDGILAFGNSLAEIYARQGWGRRAFVFHEAADTALFHPPSSPLSNRAGAVWVGNWGDGERTRELDEYLLQPTKKAGLSLSIFGVRYPDDALARLHACGANYHGWIANSQVPNIFAKHRMTIHVPRRFYSELLPGIPTIRVFEALACGIPLICAPWSDCEHLFRPGQDYLTATSQEDMCTAMHAVNSDDDLARSLIENGWQSIRERHTCRHRAVQLLAIAASMIPSMQDASA